ncbi:MAG: hypothetical protein HZA94_01820 [Candidatus Vogelbacteria bacterium]|nr:hypothetical protein [Candidatus Vogelbacteria bacterium]
MIFLMIIAGYGMYRFLHEYIGLSYWIALIGGIFFLFGSQINGNALVFPVFNYAFPLFLVLVLDIIRGSSMKHIIMKMIAINLFFFLTYFTLTVQLYYILLVLIIVFVNFNFKDDTWRVLFWSTIMWLGYILINLPQIYQLFDFSRLAQRIYAYSPLTLGDFGLFIMIALNMFRDLANESLLFIPALAALSLIDRSVKIRRTFFVTLFILLLAAFFESPLKTLASNTIFIKMDLSHLQMTLPFLFTLSSFIGIQELFSNPSLKLRYFSAAIATALGLAFLTFFVYTLTPLKSLNFALNILVLLIISLAFVYFNWRKSPAMRNNIKPMIVLFIIGALIFVGGVRAKRLFNVGEVIPYKKYFANHQDLRKILKTDNLSPFRAGAVNLPSALIQQYEIETADADGPLFYKSYKEYFKLIIASQLKTKKHHEVFDQWHNLALINGDRKIDFNLPLLLAMNVKYLISPSQEAGLAKISSNFIYIKPDQAEPFGFYSNFLPDIKAVKRLYPPTLYVYKLSNAFERGYLVKKAVILPSADKVLQTLSVQSLRDLKDSAFFSTNDVDGADLLIGGQNLGLGDKNKLELLYYSPDKIIFKARLKTPAVLVLTNNYDPKWTASVNGQKTRIYRANHAFQSVFLKKPGQYSIIFEYKDPVLWGLHGFIPLGLILINLVIFHKLWYRKKSKGDKEQ